MKTAQKSAAAGAGLKSLAYSLMLAAVNNNKEVVELLLATEGVHPDSKGLDGRTPLSHAAEYGHEAVSKLLLATPGPDSKDPVRRTPLSYATENVNIHVFKILLEMEGASTQNLRTVMTEPRHRTQREGALWKWSGYCLQ